MLPFSRLDARSRRVIFYITLAYGACVLSLILLAKSAAAIAAATPGTVGAEALDRGGLFLATEDPSQLQPAPLQATDVDIAVSGPIARVTVRQTFSNPSNLWLEGIYTFPLPDKSAVDRLTMEIGERRIRGEIQERAQARKTYTEARKAGKRTSLVSQERPNIFTTEVANIGPGEDIVIEIQYQENLRYDAGVFALRFPMVVRPRYSPGENIPRAADSGLGWSPDTTQVPDASRITPQVAAPSEGMLNPVSIDVVLDPGFPVDRVWSPYHLIDVERAGQTGYRVSLSQGEVPADSDFVLNWRPARGSEPSAGLFTENRGDDLYHVLMVMPPTADKEAVVSHSREAVFILDVSGSMAGPAIQQAKAALLMALNRLQSNDSFEVIAFSGAARPLFGLARPASPANLAAARSFVQGLKAGGGTEMASALAIALTGVEDEPRLRQIIFITDGAVGNEEALFTMIKQRLGDSRLFTVGISSSPNSFFMSEAAEAGRGTYTFIGATDEVGDKMAGLFRKLERPLLTDIEIAWPGSEAVERYPAVIPDLYDGEPVVVAFRAPKGGSGQAIVSGNMAGRPWRREVAVSPQSSNPGVAAIWARSKILEITRTARRAGAQFADETRAAILEVALKHQLLSKYTSLVAVDDTPARPPESDLVASAVPGNLPKGMDSRFVTTKKLAINRRALAAGQAQSLPKTATPATWHLLIGVIALLASLVLMLALRRRLRGAWQ